MIRTKLLAAGKIRRSDFYDLQNFYLKRLSPKPDIIEIDIKSSFTVSAVTEAYEAVIKSDHPLILCDEQGQNLNSEQFAHDLKKLAETSGKQIQFVIGEANGIPEKIKNMSVKKISFGRMTWPHLMARILLMEQLYRAQTILENHPYHRA